MKYLVQLKYTNPSHEHVSLRRRVDTVNRIVEAATEEEAINRVARQQHALGYLIREAKVIESDPKKEKEQLDEEVEQVDEFVDRETRLAARKAETGSSARVSSGDVLGRRGGHETPKQAIARRVGKDSYGIKSGGKTSIYNRSPKPNLPEEAEQVDEAGDPDKRVAGYKMPAHIKAAQAESDRLSKVEKPVQAGTLAAQRRRQAMKTEAMDPNESKGEKKIVKTTKKAAKAAQKMVNAAKGRMNKINIQPTMDIDVKSK